MAILSRASQTDYQFDGLLGNYANKIYQ